MEYIVYQYPIAESIHDLPKEEFEKEGMKIGQMFLGIDFPDFSEYVEVYRGTINPEEDFGVDSSDHHAILEKLFFMFNMDDRPGAQEFRSMSSGDVVKLDGKLYRCAMMGWKELEVA